MAADDEAYNASTKNPGVTFIFAYVLFSITMWRGVSSLPHQCYAEGILCFSDLVGSFVANVRSGEETLGQLGILRHIYLWEPDLG